MADGVVADNWSLQDVSSLLREGLEAEPAGEIIVSEEVHSYKAVSSAAIQTEALFDLMTDLVLRDEILVEERFTHAWEEYDSPVIHARNHGVIRSYPFLNEPHKISGPRKRIIEHICSTEPLKLAHAANVEGWSKKRETPDPLLSATLWGGAGMCARSFVYEKSYTPHPLRKRLFLNSGFMLPAQDALHQLTTFLEDSRVKVSKKIYGNDSLYSMYLSLPSIPIRVIQESSTPAQLITVSLEMREEFKTLREWLKSFQNAITEENQNELLRRRKELDSVEQHVESKIGYGTTKKPVSMTAGLGIFKLSVAGDPINLIRNQFGVRATLNNLIFGPNGKNELSKYVRMFGEQGTPIGYEISQHFSKSA